MLGEIVESSAFIVRRVGRATVRAVIATHDVLLLTFVYSRLRWAVVGCAAPSVVVEAIPRRERAVRVLSYDLLTPSSRETADRLVDREFVPR